MNIFVTDTSPIQSARNLPDKHIVKMPLETCQMLSIIYSDWYYGVGKLYKSDGTPYRTAHGAFRNHPCTQWAAANQYNLAWLIAHGIALCNEYTARYNKRHTCYDPIIQAVAIYDVCFDDSVSQSYRKVTSFTRAMPESIKFDTSIDTITAYQRYLNTKPWLATNYLRIPTRKPSFIITPMTQSTNEINPLTGEPIGTYSKSEPFADFSDYNGPEILSEDPVVKQKAMDQASEDAAIAKSLQDAKAAMESKKPAPAVKAMKAKSKGLVPAKKAAKTSPAKKAGRVVGISADENKFLKTVLQTIVNDAHFATMIEANQATYDKLVARYNTK